MLVHAIHSLRQLITGRSQGKKRGFAQSHLGGTLEVITSRAKPLLFCRRQKVDGTCYYCGRPATDKEHVIQRSILRSLRSVSYELAEEVIRNRKLIVPSCGECNALLVGTIQFTLSERKLFVKMRLRQKYGKLLAMPGWTEEDLAGVEGHIRGHIMRALREREIVKARISW